MKRLASILAIVLSCLFILLLAAGAYVIATADVVSTSTSTLNTGRTVTATNHGWTGVNASDSADSTTLELAGHEIVVAPTKLIVDGRQIAAIDRNAKAVDIDADKHRIVVTADGQSVVTIPR